MATRKAPSPMLGAAAMLIGTSAATLVRRDERFRHSFEVAVDAIRPDPDQPRRHIDPAALRALADTMASQGQLQPVLVRRDPEEGRRWILVAGERRWRAAQLNEWNTLLAIEHDGDPEVTALIENLQRIDLSPPEEARAIDRLISEKGWTQLHAAEVLGKSKAEVSASLRILTLPAALLDRVLTSELELPRNVLVELARIEDPAAQARLIAMAEQGSLTIQAIRLAKTTGSAAPAAPPAKAATASGLSRKAIDRLTRDLGAVREQGRALASADHEALARLRDEIDAVLAG
jgi:ParB family chromosome partitioning protein